MTTVERTKLLFSLLSFDSAIIFDILVRENVYNNEWQVSPRLYRRRTPPLIVREGAIPYGIGERMI